MKCNECEQESINRNILLRLGISQGLCLKHFDEYQNEVKKEGRKIQEDLNITNLTSKEEIVEKLFCAALIRNANTDQIQKITSDYIRMKREVYRV